MEANPGLPVSIFLAKLLSPVFVVAGISIRLEPQRFKDILRGFIESAALIYFAGFLGLLGGLALVLAHNLWAASWRLLITLIGWVTLVRASVTLFRPRSIEAGGP